MQKFNFSYDKENDDLFLYSQKSKSKGSVELGDFVLDYDSKGELVAVQIMNAAKFIKDIATEKNTTDIKRLLNNLKDTRIDIKAKNNILIIKIHLISDTDEISSVLSVPRIQEPSPALVST